MRRRVLLAMALALLPACSNTQTYHDRSGVCVNRNETRWIGVRVFSVEHPVRDRNGNTEPCPPS